MRIGWVEVFPSLVKSGYQRCKASCFFKLDVTANDVLFVVWCLKWTHADCTPWEPLFLYYLSIPILGYMHDLSRQGFRGYFIPSVCP